MSDGGTWQAIWPAPVVMLAVGVASSAVVARVAHAAAWVFGVLCGLGLVYAVRGGSESIWSASTAASAALVAAIMICTYAAAESATTRRRRYLLMRTHPSALTDPVQGWPNLAPTCFLAGLVAILAGIAALVSPDDTSGWSRRIALLILGFSMLITAMTVMFLLVNHWARFGAYVGAGLFSLAVCVIGVAVNPFAFVGSGLIGSNIAVSLAALGLVALIWNWLHRVWRQQLDGETAWTTAGRLWAHAGQIAFGNLLVAIIASIALCLWPIWGPTHATTSGWKLPSIAIVGHMLVIVAAVRSWQRWRLGRFILIASLAALGLIAFIALRFAIASA